MSQDYLDELMALWEKADAAAQKAEASGDRTELEETLREIKNLRDQ